MGMTSADSVRLMLCVDRLEHLCEKMDEIAGIVRYMANRDSVEWKGHEQKCSDTKSE